ncbi:MAG: AMIN domain-containing protein, partial [Nitrospiria bacterium]
MKILNWFYRIMIIGVLSFEMISCGLTNSMIKSGSKEKNQIQNIKVVDYADKTQIVIEGSKLISYTAFSLTDPLRYVIDLSDISSGNYKEKIDVNLGSVTSIVPIENVKPFKAVRLEIGLLTPVEPVIEKEGLKLLVNIPKKEKSPSTMDQSHLTEEAIKGKTGDSLTPGFNMTSSVMPTSQTPPTSDVSKESAPAVEQTVKTKNQVESIKVDQTEQTVNVLISGEFSVPRVFKLKGNRLVIDINGATQSVRPLIQKVHLPPVEKIRIGQHPKPKKVRIVLDLSENAPFTTETVEGGFIVHLSKGTGSSPDSQSKGEGVPAKETETGNEVSKENIPAREESSLKETPETKPETSPLESVTVSPPRKTVKRSGRGNILFVEKT